MRISFTSPVLIRNRFAAALVCAIGALNAGSASAQFAGFGEAVWHSTGENYDGQFWTRAADFNNDGRMDLLIAALFSQEVGVLLSQPDGSFENVGLPMQEAWSYSPEPGDFDGDGILDLAVGINFFGSFGKIQFYKGVGDGSFVQQGTIDWPSSLLKALAAADFDNDGKVDLAVADEHGPVRVLRNLDNFQFAFDASYSINVAISSTLTAADITGDGFCDLILTRSHSGGFFVATLRNSGDGIFVQDGDYQVGTFATAVIIEDINHDGHVDMVARNEKDVSILIANGAGGFLPETRVVPPSPSEGQLWVKEAAIADINGDGRLDLVIGANHQGPIGLWLGTQIDTYLGAPSGQLVHASTQFFTGSPFTESIFGLKVLNADNDFAPDLVVIPRSLSIGVASNLTPTTAPKPYSLLAPPNGSVNLPLPSAVAHWPGQNARLDWSDSAGFNVAYDVHIKRLGADEMVIHSAVGLTESHYDIPVGVLQPGTHYEWSVRARNAAGGAAPIQIFEFTTTTPADLTKDGEVNGADLANLLSNWGLVSP